MANSIAVGDIIEATYYAECAGQVAQNVLHFECNAIAGISATDATFALALETLTLPAYKNCMSSEATALGVKVQIIAPTRKPPVTSATIAASGGEESNVLPTMVCGLITKRTNSATRSGRGRIYVPFPGVGHLDPLGNPTNAYLVLLETFGEFFDNDITAGAAPNTANMANVLYRRSDGATTDVIECQPSPEFATQRRRSQQYGGDTLPTL